MEIVVRKARPEDLDGIYSVEKECFPGEYAYPRWLLEYYLLSSEGETLVAVDKEKVVAFIMFLNRKSRVYGSIETIDVLPSYRRRGVGKALLLKAENRMRECGLKKVFLEVNALNINALNFYKHLGYRVVKKIKNYYTTTFKGSADALRMEKNLVTEHQSPH